VADHQRFLPNWAIVTTACLCFVAVVDMPYSFYRLLRWIVCAVALMSAWQLQKSRRSGWVWSHAIVALLFNPLTPFYFSKGTWSLIDLLAGMLFLVTLQIFREDEKRAKNTDKPSLREQPDPHYF